MKPCSHNRKQIAWLALNALDAPKATVLREHLVGCEGCRRYWDEISNVTQRLAAATPDSALAASASFRRKVANKLEQVGSPSALESWFRGSLANWRVAMPVTAVLVLAVAVIAAVLRRPQPLAPTGQPAVASISGQDLAPTIANYQAVAHQSLEQLSALLTEQGNRRLPPAPIFTISGIESGPGPF
jgi:anti-sigma-K factor RskA